MLDGQPHAVHLVERDPQRADRALEHRREGVVESDARRLQFTSGLARFLATLVGKIDVVPPGEQVGDVPLALAMTDEDRIWRESTAYVTLEPCSHFGKTPPCADMLIHEGVKKVVVSNLDTNPLVGGEGIKKLRAAGIEVITGILEKEGRELNKRFFTSIEKKRPFIILKWAQTADGFIARENYDSEMDQRIWIASTGSSLAHRRRCVSRRDAYSAARQSAVKRSRLDRKKSSPDCNRSIFETQFKTPPVRWQATDDPLQRNET